MPGQEYQVSVHRSASSIDSHVLEKIAANERMCNIVFAHLLQTRASEQASQSSVANQLWIVTPNLILSCTTGLMGNYPIFIVPLQRDLRDSELLSFVIERLADELLKRIPSRRVFSVFAPDFIATRFIKACYNRTSIPSYKVPYYAAKLTYVTQNTLQNRPMAVHPGFEYELRLAVEDDIPEIAPLCWGFARESAPFLLTEQRSLMEAQLIVRKRQCWIHRINQPGEPSRIACIVVVGRDSGRVAAINKVFTHPDFRSMGCAERLVRRVCRALLATKESVILFVAHNNPAANKVYRHVGFAGLEPDAGPVEGVSSWLEIGLDRDWVELGHW